MLPLFITLIILLVVFSLLYYYNRLLHSGHLHINYGKRLSNKSHYNTHNPEICCGSCPAFSIAKRKHKNIDIKKVEVLGRCSLIPNHTDKRLISSFSPACQTWLDLITKHQESES